MPLYLFCLWNCYSKEDICFEQWEGTLFSLKIYFCCLVFKGTATNWFCRRIKKTSLFLKGFVILLNTILDKHIVSLRPDDIYVMYLLCEPLSYPRVPSNVSQYSSVKITVDRSVSMYWINIHCYVYWKVIICCFQDPI